MKLSKENATRQRVLQKAIASGKALGGLLVGFAATVVGCGERHSPAHTMGRFPDPRHQQKNSTNENTGEFVTGGDIAEPCGVSWNGRGELIERETDSDAPSGGKRKEWIK